MGKRSALFIAVALLASVPAQAGWSYTQIVRTSGGAMATPTTETRVQTEGADARMEFSGMPDNPVFTAGSYMLARGAAPKGLFLVSPAKKTFSKFDPEGLNQMMASGAAAMEGSGMQMKISGAKLEKLLEEPGGELLGVPTTHYRYRTSYTMSMGMANMEMVTVHDVVEDVWLTTEVDLAAAGAGNAMGKMSGSGALAGAAELAALERQKAAGFALKKVTVDHSKPSGKGMMARMMGGREETVTTTLEVKDLKEVAIPATTFAIPAGFVEVQMMQPGAPAPDLEVPDLEDAPDLEDEE